MLTPSHDFCLIIFKPLKFNDFDIVTADGNASRTFHLRRTITNAVSQMLAMFDTRPQPFVVFFFVKNHTQKMLRMTLPISNGSEQPLTIWKNKVFLPNGCF